MGGGLVQEILRYVSGALFLSAGAILVSVLPFTLTDDHNIEILALFLIPIGFLLSTVVLACGGLKWLSIKLRFVLIAAMLAVSTFSYHFVPRLEVLSYRFPELQVQSKKIRGPINQKVKSHSISARFLILGKISHTDLMREKTSHTEEFHRFHDSLEQASWLPEKTSGQERVSKLVRTRDRVIWYWKPNKLFFFPVARLKVSYQFPTSVNGPRALKVVHYPPTITPIIMIIGVILFFPTMIALGLGFRPRWVRRLGKQGP